MQMKFFISIILSALCLWSQSGITKTLPAAKDGIIRFTKGDVWLNGTKTKRKTGLSYGDVLKTGKNSMAIVKINPDSLIKIKPLTTITIEKPKRLKNKKGKIFTYLLKKGEVFLKINNEEKKNKHQVKVRDAIMGVRGTEFFVSESGTKKRNIWMCVNEGIVEVSIKGTPKSVLVKEGQGIVITDQNLPEVKQYEWTNELNWKMDGNYKEVNDKTNIQNIKYDLEDFNYD